VKLAVSTSAEAQKKNVQYDTGMSLLSGKYHLKFVVRENHTGRMGSCCGKRAILGFIVHEVFKEPPHVGLVNFLDVFLALLIFEALVPRFELSEVVPMGFLGSLCAHQCVDVAVNGD